MNVQQVAWWDDRYYQMDSEEGPVFLPSVTTILNIVNKPFLSRWRGDLGNYEADRKMNYAKHRGSHIHDAIARLILDGSLSCRDAKGNTTIPQDEWIQILRFKTFLGTFKAKVLRSEEVVWNGEEGYAGTMDLLLEIPEGEYEVTSRTKVHLAGGVYLADIKTGAQIDPEYHFQTAAYAEAVRRMELAAPVGSMVIHTNANNKQGWTVQVRDAEQMGKDLESFRHAHALWRVVNPNHTPTVFSMPDTITL